MILFAQCTKDEIEAYDLADDSNVELPMLKSSKTATTETQLRSFLAAAAPGDVRQVSGTINISNKELISSTAGTLSKPITIKGINNGKLRFTADTDRTCLHIKHDHYRINNLYIDANSQSKRGLLIEGAKHGIVSCVKVNRTLNEAFKIRKNNQLF